MVWNAHINYVLGPKVREREFKDAKGVPRKSPTWELVMSYEQALRDKAAYFMNRGKLADDKKVRYRLGPGSGPGLR